MRLEALIIERQASYLPDAGKLKGRLKTVSPKGEVTLLLSEEMAQRILLLAAEGIEDAARDTARFLVSEATALQLEAPQ